MSRQFGGLWQNKDFLKLWAGETISMFGTYMTQLALPLVAVVQLGASSFEMGLFGAAGSLPIVLLSLPAGVWVDHVYRRRLMIASSLGRMLVLASIPLTALAGGLGMAQLYTVVFVSGSLAVLFDTAYQAYLPSLVPRAALVEGNAKMELSSSVAQLAGPSVAGALVTLLGAPFVIAADAASFLVTALCIRSIRTPEPRPATPEQSRRILETLGEGIRFLAGHRLLRTLVLATGIGNLASGMIFGQQILFMSRTLGLGPAAIGAIMALAGPCAIVGALAAGRLSPRLGAGRTMMLGAALFIVGDWSLALAGGPVYLAVALLMLSQVLIGAGSPLYNIPAISVRQLLTPDPLLGRVVACARLIALGTTPLGGLLGGALAETLGIRATLLIAAGWMVLWGIWLAQTPVVRLHEYPAAGEPASPS